ncbi:MAG: NAD(P)/FAD-dependent oxidoreductase [Methanopyri archaeon]|nr:NAD(P)/FAD-dependent oxidoreductase [Methanopyri archaeon]
MTERYDVVVVGAGPCGSRAALEAAERGCDVLVLEKGAEIGVPKQCAEGISHQGLEDAGIEPRDEWISQEIESFTIFAPNGEELHVIPPDGGYVLERKLFDKWLAAEAAKAGAEIRVNSPVIDVVKEEGRVKGVVVDTPSGPEVVEAEVVIAADGIESRVARAAGLAEPLDPDDMCTCAQYEMVGVDLEDEHSLYFFVDLEWFPGGYFWIFPKSGGRANVGLGIRGTESDPGRAKEILDRAIEEHPVISELVGEAKVLELNVGGVPVSGPIERTYDDGIMVVGDAARQVNPLTGGGLHSGMVCARIAGEVAAEAVEEGDASASVLKRYEKEWRKELKRYDFLKEVCETLRKMDNEALNRLAEALDDETLMAIVSGKGRKKALMRLAKELKSDPSSVSKFGSLLIKYVMKTGW